MKMREKTLGAILIISLLFSGVVVVAGATKGADDQSPLPVHRGESCRDEMMDNLGLPEDEIRQLAERSALAYS